MGITKREVIFSIIIVSVMLVVGFILSDKLAMKQRDKNLRYSTAVQISSNDLWKHAVETEIGHTLAYGTVEAVGPIRMGSVPASLAIERQLEKHQMHTRTVSYTVNGKVHHRTETYWSWDYQHSDYFYADAATFLGRRMKAEFWASLIPKSYYSTEGCGHNLRYVYYRTPLKTSGTLYTNVANGFYNDAEFKEDVDIEHALDEFLIGWYVPCFWALWAALIIAAVFGFYYLDNRWLE